MDIDNVYLIAKNWFRFFMTKTKKIDFQLVDLINKDQYEKPINSYQWKFILFKKMISVQNRIIIRNNYIADNQNNVQNYELKEGFCN